MSVEASPAAIYEPVDVTVPQQLQDDASRLRVSVDAAASAPVASAPAAAPTAGATEGDTTEQEAASPAAHARPDWTTPALAALAVGAAGAALLVAARRR